MGLHGSCMVPLWDVVDVVKSRGYRKLKRGNTGVPMCMRLARFAGVVPLLLLLLLLLLLYDTAATALRECFEIRRECGLEPSLVVFGMARPHNTHTRTHTAPFVAVTKRRP